MSDTGSTRTRRHTADRSEHLDHFRARILQDALTHAIPATWTRRAADLDQVGTTWAAQAALACRRHAQLLEQNPPDWLEEFLAAALQRQDGGS